MKPLPADCLPFFDRVVIAEYTPRPVVEEVAQLLGYDAADVLSISITAGEVQVVTREPQDGVQAGLRIGPRTLHRSVIR